MLIALSFLLPIFVLTLVKEKEGTTLIFQFYIVDKILIMLRMSGLSMFAYYFSHYIQFMIMQLLCSLVFVITGLIYNLNFFTKTDPFIYLLFLLFWSNAMVAVSFLISLFFSKSRPALRIGI